MNYEKTCRIHGVLTQENIEKENNKTAKRGYTLRCKFCRLIKNRRYRENHRSQHIAYSIEWKRKNKERYNEWTRQDRLKDPEKYKKWAQISQRRMGPLKNIKQISRVRSISTNEYVKMLQAQDNKCAICKQLEKRKTGNGKIATLCLDHSHKTNLVREFLCHACNQVIGHSGDSIEILQSAITYLRKHEC